jgi:hypothetical protein
VIFIEWLGLGIEKEEICCVVNSNPIIDTTANKKYLGAHIKEKNLKRNNKVTSTIIDQSFYIKKN